MARIVKPLGELATEEKIQTLVGKLIHVPTNNHTVPNPMEGDKEEVINAWFAGQVAGYEKAYIVYDYETNEFLTEPHAFFNILLTDGKGYMLSLKDSEIVELTDEEFNEMVAEAQAIESLSDVSKELIVPERKIIMPDEVK